jgi:hypothetical protein
LSRGDIWFFWIPTLDSRDRGQREGQEF